MRSEHFALYNSITSPLRAKLRITAPPALQDCGICQRCQGEGYSGQSERSMLAPVVTLDTMARVQSAEVPPSVVAVAAVVTPLNP